MNEENEKYLISLLEYPEESETVDYKAAVKFNEKEDFSAKLVKHILGFVNAGGGYIVIGFCEDVGKKHIPDQVLDDEILASYDITRLSQYVHSFLSKEDRIDLRLAKVTFKDNKTYPIISISGFKKRPYFCRKSFKSLNTSELLLEEGAIYIRTSEAKTVKMTSPSDWNRMIDKCIALRREAKKY